MRKAPILGLVVLVVFAGCSGLGGGPKVVNEECVAVANAFTECNATVENPEDSEMTVKVTAEVGSESKSETVTLDPSERKEVTLTLSIVGDVTYTIEAEQVSS